MRKNQIAILLLTSAALLSHASPARSQATDLAIVVNENNRADSLSLAELRKVFLGERRSWAVGLPIKLVVQGPVGHERTALLKLLGISEREYKEYWIAQIFRGEADAEPLTLPTAGLVEKAVSIFPGAIALLDAGEVKPGMKVLKLNGHLPGEPGYPLH